MTHIFNVTAMKEQGLFTSGILKGTRISETAQPTVLQRRDFIFYEISGHFKKHDS